MVENLSEKNLSSRIFPNSRDFDVWKSKNTKTALLLAVIELKFFYTSSLTLDLARYLTSLSIWRLWDLIDLIEVSYNIKSKMLKNRQITYIKGAQIEA